MPIKKHFVKVKENNNIEIPKSICDSLGIGEGSTVRLFSDNNRYSFTVETLMSYENVMLLDKYKEENAQLKQKIKELESNK